MKLAVREVPSAVVIDIHGPLVGGLENMQKLHEVFQSLLREGKKDIVVNLADVPWANSPGLGLLIANHAAVTNAGGQLVLANVVEKVNHVLSIKVDNLVDVSRLLLVFKMFNSVDEALEHLIKNMDLPAFPGVI